MRPTTTSSSTATSARSAHETSCRTTTSSNGRTHLTVTDKVNAVFGANLSKRTGSFYEATYQWYGVPSYNRNNVTGLCASRLSADLAPQADCRRTADQDSWLQYARDRRPERGGEHGSRGSAPHFVGRLGAVVTLTKNLGAKLLYSEAFRQPSVVETDLVRYDEGEYSQEGNPELKPEAIATTDLQIFYGNDRVNAAVTLFDSRQSNVIAETDAFDLIQNFDRFRTRGIEGEALIRPGRNVELTAAVTYQTLEQPDRPGLQRHRDPGAAVHGQGRDLVSDGIRCDAGPPRFVFRHAEREPSCR